MMQGQVEILGGHQRFYDRVNLLIKAFEVARRVHGFRNLIGRSLNFLTTSSLCRIENACPHQRLFAWQAHEPNLTGHLRSIGAVMQPFKDGHLTAPGLSDPLAYPLRGPASVWLELRADIHRS